MIPLLKNVFNKVPSNQITNQIHKAKTYKEFFYHHNTNQEQDSISELNSILSKLRSEISELSISIEDIKKNNGGLMPYINEYDFSSIFSNFINLLTKELNNQDIHQWLSLNIQEHYYPTYNLLKKHIINEFSKIFIATKIWLDTFSNDIIFKYSIVDYETKSICHVKSNRFTETFCNNLLSNSYFRGISLLILQNQTTISYQTIFQIYPRNLNFLPYPKRVYYINEIKNRIDIQSWTNLSSETRGNEITNLVSFYNLLLQNLEKMPKPQKFKLKKGGDLEKFKSICKYFIRKHKLFDCGIDELIDIISTESDLGITFNISEEKESTFFLFIDILAKKCISGPIYEVIRDRFFFTKIIANLSDNTLANRKRNKLKTFSNEERNIIENQALQLS